VAIRIDHIGPTSVPVLAAKPVVDIQISVRHGYTTAKDAIAWNIIRRADDWAQRTGWEPGRSDA
jgi:hypothetical protein